MDQDFFPFGLKSCPHCMSLYSLNAHFPHHISCRNNAKIFFCPKKANISSPKEKKLHHIRRFLSFLSFFYLSILFSWFLLSWITLLFCSFFLESIGFFHSKSTLSNTFSLQLILSARTVTMVLIYAWFPLMSRTAAGLQIKVSWVCPTGSAQMRVLLSFWRLISASLLLLMEQIILTCFPAKIAFLWIHFFHLCSG